MPDRRFTRAAVELLSRLQFRESLGPMYLVQAGRGRQALVAGTMIGESYNPARLRASYNPGTVDTLTAAGLIAIATSTTPVVYSGGRKLDGADGWQVTLTDTGRACPTPANRTRAVGRA